MVMVVFPDGSEQECSPDDSPYEIAKKISPTLAKKVLGARINDLLWDANRPLGDLPRAELLLLTQDMTDSPDLLHLVRHSAAHVMAEAICTLWPTAKLVYGPPVENGFYYDIDLEHSISEEDFPAIEREMQRIIKRNSPFCRYELPRAEALEKLNAEGSVYKIDNAERAQGDIISFYRSGTGTAGFEDLCAGPHLPSTGKIGAFKIMSVSGSYWHGDASKQALQRIYGTAWVTSEQLENYLTRLEEARKRDHRVLGKELDIFSVHPEIGPGLILWHPNGARIRNIIERFWYDEHLRNGYEVTYTPHMASEQTYIRSGHLEKYNEMMFSPMDIDGTNYYIKPMNCPGHIQIFNSTRRSYRELPIRYCELGTVYRYEPSGTLHGMFRVRGFTQDDSHIFCTIDQLATEVASVLDLVELMMAKFGYEYKLFLATKPELHLGTDEEWEWATRALREALQLREATYEVDEGGGAFYAPKIDVKLCDSLGREWQGPTIQVDLNLPKRFNVNYIGPDNEEHPTVIVHRTVLGSMERFVGGLVEHYAGAFPLWLAPCQVKVLTISEKFSDYGYNVLKQLKAAGLRAQIDDGDEKVGAKIRRAHGERIPYMLIVGAQETEQGTVNIRARGTTDQRTETTAQFIAQLQEELAA